MILINNIKSSGKSKTYESHHGISISACCTRPYLYDYLFTQIYYVSVLGRTNHCTKRAITFRRSFLSIQINLYHKKPT